MKEVMKYPQLKPIIKNNWDLVEYYVLHWENLYKEIEKRGGGGEKVKKWLKYNCMLAYKNLYDYVWSK